tara:strand:+ start:449 stop:1108 length:660 start_codon:yes stop_codon:yes gene_type:complete
LENAPENGQEKKAEELEMGRWLFAQECKFISGATTYELLPVAILPEIAFIGRSNVGKSSLINALTGRRALARTSNTPGRTQQINFFQLQNALQLVDLPGYGYAQASKIDIKSWTRLIYDYLKGRPTLQRACVLIDGRHGLKDADITVLKELENAAVSYQLILTKCDKVKIEKIKQQIKQIENRISKHVAAYPEIFVTSASKGIGLELLRANLAILAKIS